MSLIRYGGLQLNVVKLHKFEQRPIYSDDGVDLLWVHSVISARCIVNQAATTDDQSNPPAAAWQAIHRTLTTPRKQLIFAVGGQTILDTKTALSIGGNQKAPLCDAANGPKPLYCNIVEIQGVRTFVVDWACETWTVDTSSAPSCLVSNRYEMQHSYDKHFYCTRTVNGVAVFRADALNAESLVADDFRQSLFFPLPANFHRENIVVRGSSDGNRYYYSFDDVEQPVTLVNTGITKIEGTYTSGYNYQNHPMPVFREGMVVTVYGHRLTTRKKLADVAVTVAASYDFGGAGDVTWFNDSEVQMDIVNRVCELRINRIVGGGGANNLPGGAVWIAGQKAYNTDCLKDDLVGGAIAKQDGATPQVNIWRGTDIKRLITAALSIPYSKPSSPVDPSTSKDVPPT